MRVIFPYFKGVELPISIKEISEATSLRADDMVKNIPSERLQK